jgi:hypothetical protein
MLKVAARFVNKFLTAHPARRLAPTVVRIGGNKCV